MKKLVITVAALLLPTLGMAAGGPTFPNDDITIDWDDKASMQRGAMVFTNNCMGCHSLEYSRYNRVGADLGISDEMMLDNLIFTTDENWERTKVGSLMENNMSAEYGEQAFGVVPPDLSLIARSRGVDWLYNFLRGYYVDEGRELTGVNNGVFANVGMPHVLVQYQGLREPIYETRTDGDGNERELIVGFETIKAGSMTESEYDQMVYDLVAFLDYVSEPYRQTRYTVGKWVLAFLFFMAILTYMLKREYWKDVH